MKRARLALRLAVVAFAAALYLEVGAVSEACREWIASAAAPAPPSTIAVVETMAPASALDAALILRATLRYAPQGIVFLDPITNLDGLPLLLSKLGDATQPVTFTTNTGLPPLANVRLSAASSAPLSAAGGFAPQDRPAGCEPSLIVGRNGPHAVASSPLALLLAVNRLAPTSVEGGVPGTIRAGVLIAPVKASGRASINPLAARYVESLPFDRLMVRAERSEHGEVTLDLDTLFHDRLIAVQTTGGSGATSLAALRNGLADSPAPPWAAYATVLLAASLPWWRASRFHRALLAVMATCAWLLLALAAYQEFRVVMPIIPALLLPLLALIPSGSHKPEHGELPA